MIILYVLGLGLLSGLSLWQYQRGIEKQEIAAISAQVGEIIVSQAPRGWGDYVYRQSVIEGQWLSARSFILENRIYRQRVGFEVLTPFTLTGDGAWLLVNRGWVATIEEATSKAVSGPARLAGVLYLPEKGVVFGESILPDELNSDRWPTLFSL